MDEPLRSYKEAAAFLGVPQKWLEEKVQKREVSHTRLGKHVRFTRENLDEIVRLAQRPAQTEDAAQDRFRRDTSIRPISRRRRVSQRDPNGINLKDQPGASGGNRG